jgi:hypothetical protein
MKPSHEVLSTVLALIVSALIIGCQQKQEAQTPGEADGRRASPAALESTNAVQNGSKIPKRKADTDDLKNLLLAYLNYTERQHRSPAKLEDISRALRGSPKILEAVQDGFYVVVWKMPNPSSETVLVYVKDPEADGTRLVGRGDGSVSRLRQEQFEIALKRK